jgi:hypothetical protein
MGMLVGQSTPNRYAGLGNNSIVRWQDLQKAAVKPIFPRDAESMGFFTPSNPRKIF